MEPGGDETRAGGRSGAACRSSSHAPFVTPGLPERPLDIQRLFAALAEHRVDYVVIGGVAAQVHGHRRTTRDLDVIPAPNDENLNRLANALRELEAHPRDLPGGAPTREQLGSAPVVPPLSTAHGELHILRDVPGAAAYDDLRRRGLPLDLQEVQVVIAGLDDLIAMKRASGRPADLEDLAVLTA